MYTWAFARKVRELATKVRGLKKDGVAKPFVYCELKKYVRVRFRSRVSLFSLRQVPAPVLPRALTRVSAVGW